MNRKKIFRHLLFLLCFPLIYPAYGQITAPGSSGIIQTEYTVFPETDNIYIYCSAENDTPTAALQAQTDLAGTKTFLWESYNQLTGSYEFYFSESTDEQQSLISGLQDGGYRVTITLGESEETFRAWVFTNQITATASVSGLGCGSFTLHGEFTAAQLVYYDPSNNAPIEVFQDIKVEWLRGETVVGNLLEQQINNPSAANSEYVLRVFDRFGCSATSAVMVEASGPVAAFTAEPMQGEAPLSVSFINQSVNADPNLYEWFFYRDMDEIKRESETTQQPIDSIMIVDYSENPVFTFESSGTYKVALVAKKSTESQTCTDTAYLDGFIMVDTSFIAVPNVFTPNGDGDNDNFVVQFWSMESIKISILNRWGKRIHFWESNNIRGFEETVTATVWDGRSGGRFASPGVYYYVIEGRGRDNKRRKAHGFFHLFRDKE